MQCSQFDGRMQIIFFLQVGDYCIGQQCFHLPRYPRQAYYRTRNRFNYKSRCSSDRIFDNDRSLWNECLAFLVLRRLSPVASDPINYLLPQIWMELEFLANRLGYGLAGGVIHGGSKPTGTDHDIGATGCLT